MQCPQCKRTVAAVAGASRIQCFGCGAIIDVGGKPNSSKEKRDSGGGSGSAKLLVGVISIVSGLLLLVGAGVGAYFFLGAGANEGVSTFDETQPVEAVQPAAPVELVPAFVATDEERALAGTVPESIRKQIIEMWDAMIATTRPKLLIPKGSVTRNSVEGLLSAIEQREIRNMSALLQVDENKVQAVIQVEMADRAEKELQQMQQQN